MNPAQIPFDFDGLGYDPGLDQARLTGLLARVFAYMKDGHWRTIQQVAHVCDGSETGTSAMMRKLRSAECGGHTLERRRKGKKPDSGLWEYRLVLKK